MFSIFTNTAEGLIQMAVNTVKAPIGIALAPLDDGKTFSDSMDGLVDGAEKLGKADDN